MDADRLFSSLNPLVVGLLHSPLHFLASGGLMTLSYEGRRSGRRITIPVGFQEVEDQVVVLVSKADRKRWWRNFDEARSVEIGIRGRRRSGQAHLVAADSPEFGAAFQRTFDRLGFLPRQFGIDGFHKGRALDAHQLEVLTQQARMLTVVFEDARKDA